MNNLGTYVRLPFFLRKVSHLGGLRFVLLTSGVMGDLAFFFFFFTFLPVVLEY